MLRVIVNNAVLELLKRFVYCKGSGNYHSSSVYSVLESTNPRRGMVIRPYNELPNSSSGSPQVQQDTLMGD